MAARRLRDRSDEDEYCENCDLPMVFCECFDPDEDDDDALFDADELGLDPEDDSER